MLKTSIITKARYLRKENTEVENILWQELRNNKFGLKWRRQHPLDMFILDFYAPRVKLAIELDGSLHKIHENKEYDDERTCYLKQKGITIIRFWNSEVEKDLPSVLLKIKAEIKFLMDPKTPRQ